MTTTNEVKEIRLGDVELGYSVHGTGQDRRALVFVHGYAMRSTASAYDELFELLARHVTVYALDLRGHGASADCTAGWSKRAVAEDVVAFCRAFELERPVYVGHSFGCEAGILAVADHPDVFSALCLLAPGPADPRRDPLTALDFLIEHGHDRDVLRETFRPMFHRPPGAMLDAVVDAAALVDADVHRAQRRENATVAVEDRLADVGVPTLLVLGRGDTVVSSERQHEMAGKLANTKEVIFSSEGHMVPYENPAATAREIVTFLANES